MRYLSLAVVAVALLVGCTQGPATCAGPSPKITGCDCADTGKCTCASTCKCLPTKP